MIKTSTPNRKKCHPWGDWPCACQIILWGATKLIPKLQYQFLWNFWAIIFSMTSILIVGFLSGITPAKRAEKLTPMQALRSE